MTLSVLQNHPGMETRLDLLREPRAGGGSSTNCCHHVSDFDCNRSHWKGTTLQFQYSGSPLADGIETVSAKMILALLLIFEEGVASIG